MSETRNINVQMTSFDCLSIRHANHVMVHVLVTIHGHLVKVNGHHPWSLGHSKWEILSLYVVCHCLGHHVIVYGQHGGLWAGLWVGLGVRPGARGGTGPGSLAGEGPNLHVDLL